MNLKEAFRFQNKLQALMHEAQSILDDNRNICRTEITRLRKKVTTINYNRNTVRAQVAKLNKKSDDISSRLDACMVNSKVDYEAPFDVNDSFSTVFEAFAGVQGE